MIRGLLVAAGIGTVGIPAVAVLATLAMAGGSCVTGGGLAPEAPVPADAREWVAATVAACPELPEAWVAAVMAQESGFRPDAHADDSNGGTWGLFQTNAGIWQATYGHPWSADLDANGVWDVKDGATHARVGGEYLCGRLAGVRATRGQHPDWASSQIPILDALIIAHNAGESRLRTYPNIPTITADFIQNVDQRVAEWSTVTDAGLLSDLPDDGSSPGPSNAP